MKKPRIEAEEPQSRKIIRADKAPVSGYSLVVDGHFKSHHDTVEAAEEAGRRIAGAARGTRSCQLEIGSWESGVEIDALSSLQLCNW